MHDVLESSVQSLRTTKPRENRYRVLRGVSLPEVLAIGAFMSYKNALHIFTFAYAFIHAEEEFELSMPDTHITWYL